MNNIRGRRAKIICIIDNWCGIDFCKLDERVKNDMKSLFLSSKTYEETTQFFRNYKHLDIKERMKMEKMTAIEIITPTELESNENVEKLEKAFRIANNVLYFDDNSDYQTALYEICSVLKPELDDEYGENYGKEYLEEE